MRFKHKKEKLGTERTVKKFLWFPKYIDGEYRWLEFAEWVEVCAFNYHRFIPPGYHPIPNTLTLNYRWDTVKWVKELTPEDEGFWERA